MAIDPPSDIVLEVARAADPVRAAAVAKRLTNLAANDAAGADFTAALNQTSPPETSTSARSVDLSNLRTRLANIGEAQNDRTKQAQVQFESVLLNSFVSEMLPKDSPEAYGQGLAGEMWRSMLADQVSRQIAKSGTLGIGQRLFATHPMTTGSALGHVGRMGASAATQMSANALSAPVGADTADGSFLFSAAKPL